LTTTHSEELERTIASDPALTSADNAATVKLARDLAAELDKQIADLGSGQTRTIATYAGLLGNLRRIIRDEREQRRRDGGNTPRPASRLAGIQAMQAQALNGASHD
jgi:hypothetical protein